MCHLTADLSYFGVVNGCTNKVIRCFHNNNFCEAHFEIFSYYMYTVNSESGDVYCSKLPSKKVHDDRFLGGNFLGKKLREAATVKKQKSDLIVVLHCHIAGQSPREEWLVFAIGVFSSSLSAIMQITLTCRHCTCA